MPSCQDLESFVTAWLDGAATTEQREAVESHLEACPPCRQRAEAEGSARALIRTRAQQVLRSDAPAHLKARCHALCSSHAKAATLGPKLRARPVRFSLAAALVLALAGVLIYGLTAASTTTLAAQLALDHVKCFVLFGDPREPVKPEVVKAKLREHYGWALDVPGDSEANQLSLVGGRRCLYGEGTIAHILYRHHGSALSLFMLPDTVRSSEIVDVLGHSAIIWARNNRTFVLLGSQRRDELEQVAGYMRQMVR